MHTCCSPVHTYECLECYEQFCSTHASEASRIHSICTECLDARDYLIDVDSDDEYTEVEHLDYPGYCSDLTPVPELEEPKKSKKKVEMIACVADGHECCICLSEIRGEAMHLTCNSKHMFHAQCIKKWVVNLGKHFCPLCRK